MSPAVTVTSAEALPPPGTFSVPLDGLTVTPGGAVAVQLTVWPAEPARRTSSPSALVRPESPGCRISDDGLSEPVAANVGPYDGGAF